MNLHQQSKPKLKPPPPPPKPSHLSQNKPTSTSSPNSHKRGIGWPWDHPSTLLPLFFPPNSPSSTPTWLFNWELWVPPSLPQSVNWTPCVRTAAQCADITPFLTDITTNQGRRVTHFLGFNEPEIPTQANMTVEQAVPLWRDFVLPAKRRFGFKLGSPGVSSDVARSVPWLDEFLRQMRAIDRDEGAGWDFLVLHWYGTDFGEMKAFVEMMHERYRLPVWVNEFACSSMGVGEVGVDQVEQFMREAVPWLDRCGWIERYAYFGNGQGKDVGSWVGRANNFMEVDPGSPDTDGRRLSKIGKLYLDL